MLFLRQLWLGRASILPDRKNSEPERGFFSVIFANSENSSRADVFSIPAREPLVPESLLVAAGDQEGISPVFACARSGDACRGLKHTVALNIREQSGPTESAARPPGHSTRKIPATAAWGVPTQNSLQRRASVRNSFWK